MTSSGSSKDLIKALNGFFQAPSLPLPAEVTATISSYLERHKKPDEGSGDRLGEELLQLWEKSVQAHPSKYAAFLAVLRQLRPGLRSPERVFKWWDKLLDPVLEHVAHEKGLAREVMDHTLDLLATNEYDDDPTAWSEDGLAPLVNRLLMRWMEVRGSQASRRPSTDLKEQMVKEALLAFGKRDPKGFMMALNEFVVKREYRNSALSLLCTFVASGPPHLHLILQVPLFVNILHSLQRDESTATVNLALIALVMILPFIPSSLVPFLPTLFNIYARLLFWDRDSYFAQQHTEMGADHDEAGIGISWDKALLDPDYDGRSLSYLPQYFTILYGLYPINFLDYIRKPQRYLRHANNAEDIDVQAMEIRDRSERFRKQHILHPNFYHLTIETEKTDMSRWIKSEADEVLADCLALVIDHVPGESQVRPTTPLPAPSALATGDDLSQEGLDSALLSNPANAASPHQALSVKSLPIGQPSSSFGRRGSQSSRVSSYDAAENKSGEAVDDSSPNLSADVAASLSQAQQDSVYSDQPEQKGPRQPLTSNSVPSLVLSAQEQGGQEKDLGRPPLGQASKGKAECSADLGKQVAMLQNERLRLINDLQYERFIKQQHMMHMGELRRRLIRVSATEAETQNLVMVNRSLKQRLDEAKRSEARIKKEFDHRRAMTKKWENDLSNKLRALREEQKKWQIESSELRQQLEEARAECESLRRIVETAEKEKLESQQNLEALDIGTATIEKLKGEIARLTASERALQGKEVNLEIARQEAEAAKGRAEQMAMELAAREEQLQQMQRRHEGQMEDLRSQLAEARRENQRKPPSADVAAMYESALSAAQAKHAGLQKQYNALSKKYTAVHSQLFDLQCSTAQRAGKGSAETSSLADGDGGGSAAPPAKVPVGGVRTRPRGFSDPESVDSLAFRAISPTPPLLPPPPPPAARGIGPSSAVGSAPHGPPTTASEPPLGLSHHPPEATSPHGERYFGRGGVQNAAVRKDRKDNNKKEEKRDKKPGPSFRGIRFV
ncbi:hypothetical protein VTK26DRAFT_7936 [Humicola hyalothermophila]